MLPTLTSMGSTVARPRKPAIDLPPHVHCVRAKGRAYYYLQIARGTSHETARVRLPDDPRDLEFWAMYRRLMNEPQPRIILKSFEPLVEAYKSSPEFASLAQSTKRDYERYLKIILQTWGSLDVGGLLPAHVLALRDSHQEAPGAANALVRTLSSLISWSIPRGYRTDNPCTYVRKLKTGGGWAPWPWEMIEAVRLYGLPWMWHATALALYTGQRQGDVLAMTWGQVNGGLLKVRQEKTGKELAIPAHQRLLSLLTEIPRTSVCILTSTRGTPWTSDGFRASWQKALTGPLASIRENGLVFHGLRKASVVTLRVLGRRSRRDHRTVAANGGTLRSASEPAEACSSSDTQVGTV